MKNKTLQEIKESIRLINTNKKTSALANKERLTSRMNNESDVNEKSRLQGLIDLQTNEITRKKNKREIKKKLKKCSQVDQAIKIA